MSRKLSLLPPSELNMAANDRPQCDQSGCPTNRTGKAGLLERFATMATCWSGSSMAFALAVAVIVVWIVSGPLFGFSDTWQLVINTGTTIVTFLMVFLIQRAQNKESQALQL